MKNVKRILSMLLVLCTLLSLAACNGADSDSSAPSADQSEQATFSVSVRTMGGRAMSELDVYVYADDTLKDMKGYGKTDADGVVSFQLPKDNDFVFQITGAPKGYIVDDCYSFTGGNTEVVLESKLITDDTLANANLKLGDVMYDFTVTTPGGQEVKLSEVLKEKKMVLLNFWFTTCQYCVLEFPYMQEAYAQYADDVAVIAIDPMPNDDAATIAAFQAQMGLSFPMAKCPATWPGAFGIDEYPASVIIDRNGVICLIEVGGITSLLPFVSMFETFTADDYEQKLYNSVGELVKRVVPTYEMDTSENIAAILNGNEFEVTYRPEADDEYSWPFIATEEKGVKALKASNQKIDGSYAILYADVTLKAGQAVGFDYIVSSESMNDVLHVIVDDKPVYSISGVNEVEKWETCYPWVAEKDGVYEVALCYIKDDGTSAGDDTVYLKNMRVVDAANVNVPTYIPRYAATSENGLDYTYVNIVLNKQDGFYHVGSENGPLLMADLMGTTQFNEEKTVWSMVDEGLIVVGDHNYYEELVEYCSLASRSSLDGVVPVTEDLAEYLKIVADVAGFEEDPNEWLKICKYYQAYGNNGKQLENPILGLAEFCPLTAKLGKNVESNVFYYDRALLPRGKLAKFVPEKSGAYRITSRGNSVAGIDGWIFYDTINKENPDHVFEGGERLYTEAGNVSMVVYMEKGRSYYIDICFWDMYETGTIPYDIEYLGSSYKLFTACAPGYFTYDAGATGEEMYYLIAKGIKITLGSDGYYYEDLGNGKKGSAVYADFEGISLFSGPIATVPSYDENGNPVKDANGNPVMISGMIDQGNFDFSKDENDMFVLTYLKKNNFDVEATDAELKKLWGEEYDYCEEFYKLQEVYEGKYHGTGEDLTEEMRGYLDDIIHSGPEEMRGCVKVDKRLAEILQMLMDKYTFAGVDNSWLKLCYYYQQLG